MMMLKILLKESGQRFFQTPLHGKNFLVYAPNLQMMLLRQVPSISKSIIPQLDVLIILLHDQSATIAEISILILLMLEEPKPYIDYPKNGPVFWIINISKVFEDSSPTFSGSMDDANSFFTKVISNKECDVESIKNHLQEFVPKGQEDDGLMLPPSLEEISKKLRSLSNSSPAEDKVKYRHLKSVDPKCNILALIFAHCMSENNVLDSWKTSTTILTHKKGSSDDVSNFRPIALMSCINKLLMIVIANHLISFSIDNILSTSQKSARPSEGSYEHKFIVQSLVADAQHIQKNLFLAWLDLCNTFGSVPHKVISTTLSHIGIPDSLVQLINNVYTNAITKIRTFNGTNPPIPILPGVKQGCPLSQKLFNLSIKIILCSINVKSVYNNGY